MRNFFLLIFVFLVTTLHAAPQPQVATKKPTWGHEIRLGILQHDTTVDFGHRYERGQDINLEYLFPSPELEFFEYIFSPRPHIGGSKNTGGSTDQLYAGLTWHFDFLKHYFAELTFGGEIHDGRINDATDTKNALGSRLLFRESASIGVAFMERHCLLATIEHASNASLGSENPGLTSVGIRYGYRFW